MIICPVCEHPQAQGAVCDNCGKQLVATAPIAATAATMPDLELTHHVGGGGPALPVERIPELELTRQRSGPDLPAQAFADLERHQNTAVGPARVERIADLDLGREQDDGVRTAAPVGAVTCRYCRNVQATGLFCDGCGMRLPKGAPAVAAANSAQGDGGPVKVVCGCGAKATVGTRCASCGARVVAPA